jgi:hypothetical protein
MRLALQNCNELARRDVSVRLFAALDDYLQAKAAAANSTRTIEFRWV